MSTFQFVYSFATPSLFISTHRTEHSELVLLPNHSQSSSLRSVTQLSFPLPSDHAPHRAFLAAANSTSFNLLLRPRVVVSFQDILTRSPIPTSFNCPVRCDHPVGTLRMARSIKQGKPGSPCKDIHSKGRVSDHAIRLPFGCTR